MGQQYIISGYIECFPEKNIECREAICSFGYENETPFPDIFSEPKAGYQGLMISFAGSFKNFDEDWIEWRGKFEELLGCVYAKTAYLKLETEMEGEISKVSYIPSNPINIKVSKKIKNEWVRIIEDEGGEVLEEKVEI